MSAADFATWLAAAEEAIHEQQVRFIEREFGEEAAKTANYGWGTDETESSISVATKVYGHGILESVALFPSPTIFHSFETFEE